MGDRPSAEGGQLISSHQCGGKKAHLGKGLREDRPRGLRTNVSETEEGLRAG